MISTINTFAVVLQLLVTRHSQLIIIHTFQQL